VIADRYSLEREIGRGGMGAVWLGRDESLGRKVALKRIGMLPGADSTDLARAEREGRLAARLNHPHVVTVFNVVIDPETDARWLVMEYVDGTDLARLIREHGRLSEDVVAPLLKQAADALVAAHAAGIVHRDVKPSNILVDRTGQVKLTDFGIARLAGDPTLTQTGLVTGSPAYLAPEVASGHRGDASADVWSLGATTFHALSGRPPYGDGNHVLSELYRLVNEDPPRLTDAGRLGPLLDGTMVRDPSRRWSMVEVRDFLAGSGGPPGASGLGASGLGAPGLEASAGTDDATSTRRLGAVGQPAGQDVGNGPGAAPVQPARAVPPPTGPSEASGRSGRSSTSGPSRPSRRRPLLALAALAVAVVAALVLFAVLRDPGDSSGSGTPSPSTTPSPSASSSPTRSAPPTAAGMESFIRDYVATVSTNPDAAIRMLTPKFQRESGGIKKYRAFWSGVGAGRILAISANPRTLIVSYRVRFDNFGTGRRPTVLTLVFDKGRYLIDGELT
jgi:serine/threonine protein kinase